MANHSDIVIVGGGMVGLAMAAALVDTGLNIVLLEKSDLTALTSRGYLTPQVVSAEQFESRVSAISPGNQRLLKQLGIWQRIPDSRRADYERMHVWDADGSGSIHFDAAELAEPILGSIVENQVLRAAAYAQLQQAANLQMLSHQEIIRLSEIPGALEIELVDGRRLTTQLLIGADGAMSSVRQLLAISSSQTAYGQKAFVANVKTELAHQNTAWQRFTRTGPVAFLPLPQANLCSIVWTLDDEKADALMALSKAAKTEQLTRAFEQRLGQVRAVSDYACFPLIKRHSERYLAPRCALIGDAAHTIHPLAGQGVNLGFQDITCLSQHIIRLHTKGRDFGLMGNLRPYERERKAQNYLMQNAMSGFKWLYGHQSLLPTLLRNSAMSAVDRAGPIKQQVIRHAMGL